MTKFTPFYLTYRYKATFPDFLLFTPIEKTMINQVDILVNNLIVNCALTKENI
ncbi:16676_t:CDS:1, partial [Racocetra fulgida]